MEELGMAKIKLKYNKKGKKIRLSEVVKAISDYCNDLEKYKKTYKKNIIFIERLLYRRINPSQIRETVQKLYKEYKKGKYTRKECAKYIREGQWINSIKTSSLQNFNVYIASFNEIINQLNKSIKEMEKQLKTKPLNLKHLSSAQAENNITVGKIQNAFDTISDKCRLQFASSDKNFILKNIDDIFKITSNFVNKINQNLKLNLIYEDLSYISLSKGNPKPNLNLASLKKQVTSSVLSMEKLINYFNSQLSEKNYKDKIKEVKPPSYYLNRIKNTSNHCEIVFSMVKKRMEKLKIEVDKKSNNLKFFKDISNSKQYKTFSEALNQTNKKIEYLKTIS